MNALYYHPYWEQLDKFNWKVADEMALRQYAEGKVTMQQYGRWIRTKAAVEEFKGTSKLIPSHQERLLDLMIMGLIPKDKRN